MYISRIVGSRRYPAVRILEIEYRFNTTLFKWKGLSVNIRGFLVILSFKDQWTRPHVSSSLFVFPTYKLFKMSCCDFESCRQTYGRLKSDFHLDDLNSLTHDSSNFKYTNEVGFSQLALFIPYPLFLSPPSLTPILCKYKKFL